MQALRPSLLLTVVLLLGAGCGAPSATPIQTPTVTQAPTPTTAEPPAGTSTPQALEYVVQAGDNLWSIAVRFETTVEKIVECNRLVTTTIYSGTRLRIPGSETTVATPAVGPRVPRTPLPEPTVPTSEAGSSPTRQADEVQVGTPTDDVLALWGAPLRVKRVGRDDEGLIVEWGYPDVELIIRRWETAGVYCYRVAEIRPR